MKNRRRFRFKINGDTMTTIVVSSLLFCVAVVIWGMIQASHLLLVYMYPFSIRKE